MSKTLFKKRILILSPHPDDEVVGFCAAIGRAQDEGAKIFVMHLTHGCIAKETMWPWRRHFYMKNVTLRRQEAEKVAERLGIEIISISDRPTRHLWCNLREIKKEIEQAIDDFDVDQLWVPAYEGGHADHDALNGLVSTFKDNISILEFAEYNNAGDQARSHIFPMKNVTQKMIELTGEEQALKKQCLEMYASEKNNLSYVGLAMESYRPIMHYNYTKPPHEGMLWYKRFDWVPFPHPSIDRTKPEDVCKAIEEVMY